jgi:predicted negative regulator of RcsB-dependent stress response
LRKDLFQKRREVSVVLVVLASVLFFGWLRWKFSCTHRIIADFSAFETQKNR